MYVCVCVSNLQVGTPIASWRGMGLPSPARPLSPLSPPRRKSPIPQEATGRAVGHEPLTREQVEARWEARGWKDSDVFTLDDMPMIVSMGPMTRVIEEQSRCKVHNGNKSAIATQIFDQLRTRSPRAARCRSRSPLRSLSPIDSPPLMAPSPTLQWRRPEFA
eukprot:TRINITY_DN13207_c0_g2_i3.p1 TRINITY_DN13207_c0_g2~~TRINITY_DN13207_c0_g2_i3.p1  ORF type:complete len:162 (-),score=17.17 TRINITY_DN13207_c0_g2_i3:336-821(-)